MKNIHSNNLKYLTNVKHIKSLSKGECCTVDLYKCMGNCKKSESEIVIKHIKGEWNKKRNKYLLNEYTIGIILSHPYIRQTLDIDLINHSLIFEYCNGINFFSFLTKIKHSLQDEYMYFSQLLDGIEYMHNLGIAHLDIKLENIMVDLSSKKIKIIDFGESRVFHTGFNNNIIKEKGLKGTIQYMSPEEFTDKEYNPEKVDIWMCGIILYEILYKSTPWEQATICNKRFNDFIKYFNDNNDLCPKIFNIEQDNEKYLRILKKMIDPNPENRSSISIINSDFKSIKYC